MSIALSLGNNLTTGGIFKPAAVNNTSCNNITTFAGLTGGATLNLISTQTASDSASVSFTTGIDSTYDEYIFSFIHMNTSSGSSLLFNCSTDGGSNYNVTKQTTFVAAYHYENDSSTLLTYNVNADKQNSTDYMGLASGIGSGADDNASGFLHLFAPSSTTYMKQFIATATHSQSYAYQQYVGGYFNTTSAINAIDFKMSTGNVTGGIIKMYGVTKS